MRTGKQAMMHETNLKTPSNEQVMRARPRGDRRETKLFLDIGDDRRDRPQSSQERDLTYCTRKSGSYGLRSAGWG